MFLIARGQVFFDKCPPDITSRVENKFGRDHSIFDADFPALGFSASIIPQRRAGACIYFNISWVLISELDATVLGGSHDDPAISKDWSERFVILHELVPVAFLKFLRPNSGLAGQLGAQFTVLLNIQPNPLVKMPSCHRRVETVVRSRLMVVIFDFGEPVELPMQFFEHVAPRLNTECRQVSCHDPIINIQHDAAQAQASDKSDELSE